MDITYLPLKRGYLYLNAIIDLHTRFVVGWSLSNTMQASWCVETFEDGGELYKGVEYYMKYYNYNRRHANLKHDTPASRYFPSLPSSLSEEESEEKYLFYLKPA